MEGYMGYLPRPDRVYPIGSCVLRGAGCHDNGDHGLYGAPRHIKEWYWKYSSLQLRVELVRDMTPLNPNLAPRG
eukprot:2419679-Pleurochrysis_carterae.AAC.1